MSLTGTPAGPTPENQRDAMPRWAVRSQPTAAAPPSPPAAPAARSNPRPGEGPALPPLRVVIVPRLRKRLPGWS